MRRLLLPIAFLLLAAPAVARENPADALIDIPIEAARYDKATHCDPKEKRGVKLMTAWLEDNVRGVFWGSYRCEKWGEHEASLHAENRAIDWHLDAASKPDRRAARELIDLLLATDAAGNEQALARRMGVEELIWDCEYWAAGMPEFIPYRPCFDKKGRPLERVNVTVAHRDHVHIGMTLPGAKGRTSFWRRHTG